MELIQPCHLITIPVGGRLNCRCCEKCLRTKLNLLVLGLPIRSQTFADVTLTRQDQLSLPLVSGAAGHPAIF